MFLKQLQGMAGIAERKAAQRAAKAETEQNCSGNAFAGTGDFKQQYLVLSENLLIWCRILSLVWEDGKRKNKNEKTEYRLYSPAFSDNIFMWGTAITGRRSVLLRRGTIPLTTGKTGKGGIA